MGYTMRNEEVLRLISEASDEQLLTELISGAFERNILVNRIARLEVPAEMKISLIMATDSGDKRAVVSDMIGQLESSNGNKSKSLSQIFDRIDWKRIGEVAAKCLNPRNIEDSERVASEAKTQNESWVYFIESKDSGLVKIGYSKRPKDRFNAIKTMSPEHLNLIGVIPGGKSEEAELHKKFERHREHGEWFRKVPELATFIDRQTSKA